MKIANQDGDAESVEEDEQREDIKVGRKERKNGQGAEVLPQKMMDRSPLDVFSSSSSSSTCNSTTLQELSHTFQMFSPLAASHWKSLSVSCVTVCDLIPLQPAARPPVNKARSAAPQAPGGASASKLGPKGVLKAELIRGGTKYQYGKLLRCFNSKTNPRPLFL